MCGAQTYDGHTGTDSDIRSFREMDIGVPVFAALDGRVISVQEVVAGQQVGWTASSGNSSWPHLHFTSQAGGEIDEPFTGPCNEGSSAMRSRRRFRRSRTSEISR